jgi:hypothetical protein
MSWIHRVSDALRRRPGWIAALVLAMVDAALLAPVLFGHRYLTAAADLYTMAPWRAGAPHGVVAYTNRVLLDDPMQFYPWRAYAASAVRSGSIPGWNPWVGGGTPFFGNQQAALLSPFSVPIWLFGAWHGAAVAAWLKLWCAGFGAYLLARNLRLPWLPSLLVGLAYGSAPAIQVWLIHPQSSVIVLLPWIVWSARRVVEAPAGRSIATLSVIVGLAMLGGHPGSQIHVLLITVLLAAWFAWSRAEPVARRAARLGAVGVGLVLGIALGAIALLPAWTQVPGSNGDLVHSGGGPFLPAQALMGLAFPDWWGRPTGLEVAGPFNFNERTTYVGVMVLLLAVAGAVGRDGRRDRLAWVFLAIGCMLVVQGTGPIPRVVGHIPVLGHIQNARLIMGEQLALAVLAGYGLRDALESRRSALVAVGAGVVVTAVGLFAELGVPAHQRPLTERAVAWFVVFAVAGAVALATRRRLGATVAGLLLCAVVAADLGHFAAGYIPAAPARYLDHIPVPPSLRLLQADLGGRRYLSLGNAGFADLNMRFQVRAALSYDPPAPSTAFARLLYAGQTRLHTERPYLSTIVPSSRAFLTVLGVRDIIDRPHHHMPVGLGLMPAYSGPDAVVWRFPDPLPGVWLPRRIVSVASRDAAISALVAHPESASTTAYVEHAAPEPAAGTVRVVVDRPEDVRVDARLARGGLVVLDDIADPGWSATVDGHPAKGVRADGLLRGVTVPAGRHLLRWTYTPAGLHAGAALSAFGMLAVLGLVLRPKRRDEEARTGVTSRGARG